MRLGGVNNLAAMRGHFPHVRHSACIWPSPTHSASVMSPIACDVPMLTIAASTNALQSDTLGLGWAGNLTTFGISAPAHRAPRRPKRRENDATRRFRNRFIVRSRIFDRGERQGRHQALNVHVDSPLALFSPPVARTGGVGAVGFQPDRSRETCKREGCRPRPCLGVAPELRRRLRPLETGRYAPAGCRDGVLDCRQDSQVGVPVHIDPPFRQGRQ